MTAHDAPAGPAEGPDPVADFVACGAGTARCCIFLGMGAGGAQCLRPTGLRTLLLDRHAAGTMNAKRNPIAAFPDCQTEERYD